MLYFDSFVIHVIFLQHTILALDAAISFNDKVSHSNRGLDMMLDTGAQALKQLREQRGSLQVRIIKQVKIKIHMSVFKWILKIAKKYPIEPPR